jgi:hypothetical protein
MTATGTISAGQAFTATASMAAALVHFTPEGHKLEASKMLSPVMNAIR